MYVQALGGGLAVECDVKGTVSVPVSCHFHACQSIFHLKRTPFFFLCCSSWGYLLHLPPPPSPVWFVNGEREARSSRSSQRFGVLPLPCRPWTVSSSWWLQTARSCTSPKPPPSIWVCHRYVMHARSGDYLHTPGFACSEEQAWVLSTMCTHIYSSVNPIHAKLSPHL